MDAQTMEVISSSARIILISAVNYGVATFIINAILDRRRSLWPLCIYWAGKILTQGVLIGHVFSHYFEDAQWLQVLSVLAVLIFAVMTYVMYYITFKGEFLKVAIAALIGDVTSAFLGAFAQIFINLIEGKKDILALNDPIQPMDLGISIVNIILLFFFYHFAKPYLRRFKECNLRYRKMLWTIFVSYIVLGSTSILASYSRMAFVIALEMLCGAAFIAGICFMVIKYHKNLNIKRRYMEIQQKVTEAHYEAVQGQIHEMEQNQQRIDRQMKEIIRLQDNAADSERLRLYLANLRQNYEDIRAGIYCDDWKRDAVIYSQALVLKKAGIEFECSIQERDIGTFEEEDYIQILLLLLNMGAKLNEELIIPKKEVQLHMAMVRNQLVIDFFSTCDEKCRISKREFKGYLKKYQGEMDVSKSENTVNIRLALQRKKQEEENGCKQK